MQRPQQTIKKTVTLPLDEPTADALEHLKRKAGIKTDRDALRHALVEQARVYRERDARLAHLDAMTPTSVGLVARVSEEGR